MILREPDHTGADLPHVTQAGRAFSRLPGATQRRQQHGNQYCNNSNDN